VDNKVDTLSRRLCTLQTLSAEVIIFECFIQYYPTCRDFGKIHASLIRVPSTLVEGFTIVDGFLFRGTQLCIPNTSLWDHLIWKIHAGRVAGHPRQDIALVEDRFYWHSVKRDVARVVSHCQVCQFAKGKK